MSDLHPDHVARKQFSLSFRGFDQHEVRAFLATVAGELSAWEEREITLRARLADLEQLPKSVADLDEAAIEAALGETATRIIHAAREAAAEVRSRADAEAAQKVGEAESILAKTTSEAAEANAALRADTESALNTLREESEQQAASVIEDARKRAAAMIVDAGETRDRTLRDLADRRAAIVAEIEQLQAARDRLRAAHDSVRSALDVAVLDVEAAEMRANDVLARVKPLDLPDAPPMPAVVEDVTEQATGGDDIVSDAEVIEIPAADVPVATEPAVGESADDSASSDDEPVAAVEAPPDERRSSALRLLRSRPEADGNPTSPPVDDPYEGVRIIRPEVTPEPVPVVADATPESSSATTETSTDDERVAEEAAVESTDDEAVLDDETSDDDADEAAALADATEDEPVAADDQDPVVAIEVVDEPADVLDTADADADADVDADSEAETPSPPEDAPVDDLFARLRADRAASLAKATAVLAATDASPSEPGEAVPVPAAAIDADASPDLAFLAARDAAVADAERAVVRSLKRALADEQNEVLDALRRLRGKPSVDALLPDVAVHEARYDAVLGSGAATAAVAGGELAGGGGDAGAVTAEIGRALATDLRARVERSVDDAAGDVETLAEAISATYREWKTSRAEPLARDVIAAAYATGTYVAASGPLRWVVDPAEGGCPDCEDNALAGGTPKGTAFPTGQVRPPAHVGCRCALVPVS